MGLRGFFHELKEKFKGKRKPDERGDDADMESVVPARPADGMQVPSADPPPQTDVLGIVSANRSKDNQARRERDVGGREVGHKYSHRYSDVEAAVGSGPGRNRDDTDGGSIEQFFPSSSTPVSRSGEPQSM